MKKLKKIIYAGLQYHYKNIKWGRSYEYYNYYQTLVRMPQFKVIEFDWWKYLVKYGQDEMNRKLINKCQEIQPDLVFFNLYREEISPETIKKISQKYKTMIWFADDMSRFDSFIKYYAPHFSHVITVSSQLLPKYRKIGVSQVILSQFGINHYLYKNLKLSKKYDVGFIGSIHGNRKRLLQEIKNKNIDIYLAGLRQKHGHIPFSQMVKIINQTKINLNFTSWSFSFSFYVTYLPWFLQPGYNSLTDFPGGINARIFEVPGCRGFLLTSKTNQLHKYFKIGSEIEVYDNFPDLMDKIKYYLKNTKQREQIAQNGYRRVLTDHTYEKRFTNIFQKIGLLKK